MKVFRLKSQMFGDGNKRVRFLKPRNDRYFVNSKRESQYNFSIPVLRGQLQEGCHIICRSTAHRLYWMQRVLQQDTADSFVAFVMLWRLICPRYKAKCQTLLGANDNVMSGERRVVTFENVGRKLESGHSYLPGNLRKKRCPINNDFFSRFVDSRLTTSDILLRNTVNQPWQWTPQPRQLNRST